MHKLTREQHRILTAMEQDLFSGERRGLWATRIGGGYSAIFVRYYLDGDREDVSVRMLCALRRMGLIELHPHYRPCGRIQRSIGLLDVRGEFYRVTDAGREALKAWAE
jgi:hypothetical protein